jgi:hypothetical protein
MLIPKLIDLTGNIRHNGEGRARNEAFRAIPELEPSDWIPAFAGMTLKDSSTYNRSP